MALSPPAIAAYKLFIALCTALSIVTGILGWVAYRRSSKAFPAAHFALAIPILSSISSAFWIMFAFRFRRADHNKRKAKSIAFDLLIHVAILITCVVISVITIRRQTTHGCPLGHPSTKASTKGTGKWSAVGECAGAPYTGPIGLYLIGIWTFATAFNIFWLANLKSVQYRRANTDTPWEGGVGA